MTLSFLRDRYLLVVETSRQKCRSVHLTLRSSVSASVRCLHVLRKFLDWFLNLTLIRHLCLGKLRALLLWLQLAVRLKLNIVVEDDFYIIAHFCRQVLELSKRQPCHLLIAQLVLIVWRVSHGLLGFLSGACLKRLEATTWQLWWALRVNSGYSRRGVSYLCLNTASVAGVEAEGALGLNEGVRPSVMNMQWLELLMLLRRSWLCWVQEWHIRATIVLVTSALALNIMCDCRWVQYQRKLIITKVTLFILSRRPRWYTNLHSLRFILLVIVEAGKTDVRGTSLHLRAWLLWSNIILADIVSKCC